MSTLTQPQTHLHMNETRTKVSLWAVPIGRFFYSLIFILAGFNHFNSGSVSYAAAQGVPFADILVPLSGVLALAGGLSVLFGYHTRMGAIVLLFFLVPVTMLMHNFWTLADPLAFQAQMVHFLKNLALIGAAIIFAFYGAGPISIDKKMAKTKTRN